MPGRPTELDVRRARSTVYTPNAHPVFVTKYRRPVFTNTMLTHCERLMHDLCAGAGAQPREFNGATDHVHLLVHYPPHQCWSTSSTACRLADCASGAPPMCANTCGARISGHRPTFAAFCRGAPLTVIKQYLEQQNLPD